MTEKDKQEMENLVQQKQDLLNQIDKLDQKAMEKGLPWSKAEELYMTEKDLNAQYNTTPSSIMSTQFNPYMTRTMPATYQYGGVTGNLFGQTLNGSTPSLTTLADGPFTIIQKYLQLLEAQSEVLEYKNWPDNFNFTYHDFERKLVESGRCAVVRINDECYLTDYMPAKQDYLNRPITIKPMFFKDIKEEQKPSWKNKEFAKEDFVLAFNNFNSMSTFPRVIRWLILWEQANYQLEKQNRILNPKVFVNGNLKLRKANLDKPLNEALNNEDIFQQIFLPSDVAGRDQMINGVKFQDALDKLFATIQFESKVPDYEAIMSIAEDHINEAIGLSINPESDKAERVNTLEINSAQDLTRLTAKHMFKMRKEAIDEMNDKFGTNISVSQDNTAMEKSIEDTNTGNIERNVDGGEEDER